MIRLQHVTKTYPLGNGYHKVLDDVSLDIPADVNVGILGRNGQGKSTLLRLIAGIEMPDSGEVRRTKRVSWPIGFTGGFNPTMTGAENARFVSRIYGVDVDRVLDEVLDFSELGEYINMPVRTYSSGMRARLAFALSMAINFDTYLIDEVIAVGDKPFKEKCRHALKEQNKRSSVIMVSHSMDTIRQYCDRCAVLKDGRLRMFDSVDEAAEIYDAA